MTSALDPLPAPETLISDGAGRWLLRWARFSLGHALTGLSDGLERCLHTFSEPAPQAVQIHRPCFVSIHLEGQLRGCVGTLSDDHPLWYATAASAVAAATRDPRFQPLSIDELRVSMLEISVLSAVVALDPGAVQVGHHGLVIHQGDRRGVLLPQVAVEAGWDRNTFLAHTCHKAGLAPDAWRACNTCVEGFVAKRVCERGAFGGLKRCTGFDAVK